MMQFTENQVPVSICLDELLAFNIKGSTFDY